MAHTSVIALFDNNAPISKGWLAVYALASIAFGIVAVIFPGAVAGLLLLFLASWLVVGGIYRIKFAVRVRKQIDGEWWIGLSGTRSGQVGQASQDATAPRTEHRGDEGLPQPAVCRGAQ
jgi:uncharacterized membrane protein HdeD (DUF308 family)